MVTFALAGDRIKIERTSYRGKVERLMTISVALDRDAKCTLIDEDRASWRPWQIRRMALEETLFGPLGTS